MKKILNRLGLRRMKEGYWLDISNDEKHIVGCPIVDLLESGEARVYIGEAKKWLHITLTMKEEG